jgi:hypothetical protein
MTCNRFLHILQYIHFANNQNAIDNNDPKYNRLWKIRYIFEILNNTFSTYYTPTEHLTADKVIVHFKRRVNFKQYIPTSTNVLELRYIIYVILADIHRTWMNAQGRTGHVRLLT